MSVFSVSIKEKECSDQVKGLAQTLGLSVSRYFRELHEAYFARKIKGINWEEFQSISGSEKLTLEKMDIPGYKTLYLKEGTYERFEQWRLRQEELNPDAPRGYDAAVNAAIDELSGTPKGESPADEWGEI